MGVILTKEQEYVVNEAYRFFKYSSEQVFQYAGGAGRGKSVVMNAIIDRLGYDLDSLLPMAYTGAASLVMRTKGLYNAKTIHSSLYTPTKQVQVKDGKIVMNGYFNRPKTEIGFEPKDVSDKIAMFIDEGGTAPFKMKSDIESRNLKIVVAGDLDQLPPVKDKPAYLVDGKIHRLITPMRQAENDGIFYVSERARLGLPIHKGFYGNALVIDEDELTDDMIRYSDVVICSKNKTREYFNNHIRHNILGIKQDLPVRGERMICRNNNWIIEVDGINLVNGLMGTVLNSPSVADFDGKLYHIDFAPFLSYAPFIRIPCNYKYLIAPYDKKQEIKTNKYEEGEFFEFSYAISSYLSQGNEFCNVIYIEEDFIPSIQKNTNYVGASRAKGFLIYVKKKRKFYY